MSTLALTHCWFTRNHYPNHKPRERFEGAFYAYCSHCRRPIFSIDGSMWHIDGGFNVDTLGEMANSFISVDEPTEGMNIARIPVSPTATDKDVAELIEQIRLDYGIGEPGVTLTLRDHRPHKARQAPSRKSKQLRGSVA